MKKEPGPFAFFIIGVIAILVAIWGGACSIHFLPDDFKVAGMITALFIGCLGFGSMMLAMELSNK